MVTPPAPTAGAELAGSYALSDTGAWVVGGPASASAAPVALNWNGTAWSSVPTPTPSGSTPDALAVSADGPDDIWGIYRNDQVTHYNGTSWSAYTLSGSSGTAFESVVALSPTDVWVGEPTAPAPCSSTSTGRRGK